MHAADLVGYLASLLVLTVFLIRGIVALGIAAIASNHPELEVTFPAP